jgi:hypothetical protein
MVMAEPKVSREQWEAQTERLYARVGKIVVLSEHLKFAISLCCLQVLQVRGLPQGYAQTVLAGQNLEAMRRTWEALMKLSYVGDADAIGMISHLSDRLDNIIARRNDTVHRRWDIGWGNEQTESYEVATGTRTERNIGKKGRGGVKFTDKESRDFEEIIEEIRKVSSLVMRFGACIAHAMSGPDRGKPINNFHYDAEGRLHDAPPTNLS